MTPSESSSVSNGRALSNGARLAVAFWQWRPGQSTSALSEDVQHPRHPLSTGTDGLGHRHRPYPPRLLHRTNGGRAANRGRREDSGRRRSQDSVHDINANSAAWVDMSATGPHDHEVGVTVVSHPSPLPTGWYAHEWGTVAVNPFLNQEQSIRRGKRWSWPSP